MGVIAYIRSGPGSTAGRDVNKLDLAIFGAALIGGAIGFLWFNAFPAEVSWATRARWRSAARCGFAMMTKTELLLLLVGGIFVIEALSVIAAGLVVQVLGATHLPDGPDPPPLRDEGVVRDEDHGALLDRDRDPLRGRLRALLRVLPAAADR